MITHLSGRLVVDFFCGNQGETHRQEGNADNESSNVWRCLKCLAYVIVRCGQDNYLALKALKAEIAGSLDPLAECTEAICSGKDSTSNLI